MEVRIPIGVLRCGCGTRSISSFRGLDKSLLNELLVAVVGAVDVVENRCLAAQTLMFELWVRWGGFCESKWGLVGKSFPW